MRKGTVAAILALLMALLCATAWAEETMKSGDYEYRVLDDGTAEITKYSGKDETLEVPAVLDGRSVTRIGDGAFSCCDSLTSLTLPDSVTEIGDYAFGDCIELTSVTLPDSVTEIGDYAFSWCTSLSSITLPSSVESIGKEAFANCPNLTLTVPRDSYAASYAKENGIPYEYPDSHDWLND